MGYIRIEMDVLPWKCTDQLHSNTGHSDYQSNTKSQWGSRAPSRLAPPTGTSAFWAFLSLSSPISKHTRIHTQTSRAFAEAKFHCFLFQTPIFSKSDYQDYFPSPLRLATCIVNNQPQLFWRLFVCLSSGWWRIKSFWMPSHTDKDLGQQTK